jgi:hypothetical protein
MIKLKGEVILRLLREIVNKFAFSLASSYLRKSFV